jgi:glycosyltransferase involved in cell wall biosynthesis
VKLAVVTPRYGDDIAGGAETAARLLATELVARTPWRVEVLTTTARDATTWSNDFPTEASVLDGVEVRRFAVARTRRADFDRLCARLLYRPRRASPEEQVAWVEEQGPFAPALVAAVAASDADVVAFHPYLYYPTVVGLPLVARRAVLHPAAHDEQPIRLPIFRETFAAAAGLVYWSEAERRFTERLFPVAARPQLVLGLGVEARAGDVTAARAHVGIGDEPFLLCLGRVDDGKGARLLAECFTRYKQRRPGDLKLVYAGPVIDAPPAHPDIVIAGRVDEDVKWGLLRAALGLVSPSAYESFSIVLLEAWSVGTPALVNRRCDVTTEHALASGGGLPFDSYPEFEVALDRLRDSPETRRAMGAAGRAYVEAHFRWPDIVDRYAAHLERIAQHATT